MDNGATFEELREQYGKNYYRVLTHRIEKKLDQMENDIEFYNKAVQKASQEEKKKRKKIRPEL